VTAEGRSALIRGSVFLGLSGGVLLVATAVTLWLVREQIGWPTSESTYVVQDVANEASMVAAQGRIWMTDVAAAVAPPLIAAAVAALLAGGALRAAAGRPVPSDSGPAVDAGTPSSRRVGATSAPGREADEGLDRYRPPRPTATRR
jgi:hypothetical protein